METNKSYTEITDEIIWDDFTLIEGSDSAMTEQEIRELFGVDDSQTTDNIFQGHLLNITKSAN